MLSLGDKYIPQLEFSRCSGKEVPSKVCMLFPVFHIQQGDSSYGSDQQAPHRSDQGTKRFVSQQMALFLIITCPKIVHQIIA